MTVGSTALHADAARYLLASRSENTYRAYRSDVQHFQNWGGSIPCQAETIANYLASFAGLLKIATLKRRVSAISAAHRDLDSDPTKSAIVSRVMHGIARCHSRNRRQARPISIDDLKSYFARTSPTKTSDRDRAILLVGFFGAFRRSELVGLNVEDIVICSGLAELTIRRSKTDPIGCSRIIHFQERDDEICPVRALRETIAIRSSGPLFVGSDGRRLSDRTVSRIVKRAAAILGGNPSEFSAHSLRAGFATEAALKGFDATMIARQTGHRSIQTVSTYVRPYAFPGL